MIGWRQGRKQAEGCSARGLFIQTTRGHSARRRAHQPAARASALVLISFASLPHAPSRASPRAPPPSLALCRCSTEGRRVPGQPPGLLHAIQLPARLSQHRSARHPPRRGGARHARVRVAVFGGCALPLLLLPALVPLLMPRLDLRLHLLACGKAASGRQQAAAGECWPGVLPNGCCSLPDCVPSAGCWRVPASFSGRPYVSFCAGPSPSIWVGLCLKSGGGRGDRMWNWGLSAKFAAKHPLAARLRSDGIPRCPLPPGRRCAARRAPPQRRHSPSTERRRFAGLGKACAECRMCQRGPPDTARLQPGLL